MRLEVLGGDPIRVPNPKGAADRKPGCSDDQRLDSQRPFPFFLDRIRKSIERQLEHQSAAQSPSEAQGDPPLVSAADPYGSVDPHPKIQPL